MHDRVCSWVWTYMPHVRMHITAHYLWAFTNTHNTMQADCQYGFCCSGVKWIYVDDTGVGCPPNNMAPCSCVQFRGIVFEKASTQSSPRLNSCLTRYNLLSSSFRGARSLCPATLLLNLSAELQKQRSINLQRVLLYRFSTWKYFDWDKSYWRLPNGGLVG